ncbi:UDP-glucosyltransferase 2-like [Epargyreus clarus]|uniref:UDP-glucosyltransferase 2-like n=1 Tax=Epargyreus clarus TaxID=520877 RepID=UPI003C2CBFBA
MYIIYTISLLLNFALYYDAAKILVVIPTPSLSHQVVFYPLTQELAKRGHEVTVITTDPAFTKGEAPPNLTEIDIHDTYKIVQKEIVAVKIGSGESICDQMNIIYNILSKSFEKGVQSDEVKNLLQYNEDYFDLLMIEAVVKPALIFSHFFKAPVISISSLGALMDGGAPVHPLLYPSMNQYKLYNLNIWDKIIQLYNAFQLKILEEDYETINNVLLRNIFGPKVPTLQELTKNIDMTFLNVHPIWIDNQPMPPNFIFLGGLHNAEYTQGITKNNKIQKKKELPQILKSYLDSSKHGVVYMSLGTNIQLSQLGSQTLDMFFNVFSELPYNFVVKCDMENKSHPKNVKLVKWVPQSNLLKHPKVKLFITQCGLQSTDEAIVAGVPVIGIPMFADQFYNSEKYFKHKIGLKYEIKCLRADLLKNAIKTVIEDESYRKNVIRLRSLMYDKPQTSLERAIWWTEHVLRHGGAKHLRTSAANVFWPEYFELDLVLILLVIILSLVGLICVIIYYICKFVSKQIMNNKEE